MSSFEKLAAERLMRSVQIPMTPVIEGKLISLFRSIKEGDFCCFIDAPDTLPPVLWEAGCEGEPLPKRALVIQGNRLYIQKTWALESLILQKVADLLQQPVWKGDPQKFREALVQLGDRLNPAQKQAVERAYESSLALFTGGPGTGKSYTAAWFVRLLAEAHGRRFKTIIAAPTGKAAAHLEMAMAAQGALPEGVRCESATLHRLLDLYPYRQQFDSGRLLDADLVIVDEASMLDASLLLHLLQAIGPRTRLLLLGDPNQLPPVEGTGFFPEMAELFGQKLEQSMRMGEGSLWQLSQAILAGRAEEARRLHSEAIEWRSWISNPSEMAKYLWERLPAVQYQERPDPLALLQQQKRFCILSALRRGPFGVDALNRQILEHYMRERRSGWTAMPILIIQNNEAQQLYNGTIGVLIQERSGSYAYFQSAGGIRSIPEAALPPYELAFCLSVHKSQGSEFDEVLVLLGPGSERFGKEALYTAVTRAKKKVSLCVEESALQAALGAARQKRSGFIERIGAYVTSPSRKGEGF